MLRRYGDANMGDRNKFKLLHQIDGLSAGSASVRTIIVRGIPEVQASVKKAIGTIQGKYFPVKEREKILSDEFRYRETHFRYIKDALSKGFELNDILTAHDEIVEPSIRKIYQPRAGGQHPSKVMHIDSSEERSAEIFSHGAFVDEKGCYMDGAFVVSINVRKDGHFPEDFQPSAYMNGHLIKHDKYSIPYEPFIAAFGGEAKRRGSTIEQELALAATRLEIFVRQYREAGFHLDSSNGVPYRIANIRDELHRTYLPLVLHDTVDCEYYVKDGNVLMPLETWFNKTGLDAVPSVQKDIEALKRHRDEAGYFDEYIQLTSGRKKSECTDSRENCPQNNVRSSIRIIGSILDAEERKRVLQTPGLQYFTNGLHFGCGYLTTAMKLHEMGREIRAIFEKGEREGKGEMVSSARDFIKSHMQHVFDGTWKNTALNTFLSELNAINGAPLSASSVGLLQELFKSSTADLREIARHMKERDILTWSDELGTLVMPAALKIDNLLGETSKLLPHNHSSDGKKASEQQKAYYDSITVQVAKDVEQSWVASLNDVGTSNVKVRVVIKSYEDGVSYMVNDGGELIDPFKTKQAA